MKKKTCLIIVLLLTLFSVVAYAGGSQEKIKRIDEEFTSKTWTSRENWVYEANQEVANIINQKYDDKVITGEKINGRYVIANHKKGIKELYGWKKKKKETPFSNEYIEKTFCHPDGKPFSAKSVNTYRWKNGLTGNDE